MLFTYTQIEELLSTLGELSGLDAQLTQTCGGLIREERYDEAVRRAFALLDERLRERLDVSEGSGISLIRKAFDTDGGELVHRMNRPTAEVQGIRALFLGAVVALGGQSTFARAGYSRDEARAIIHLVNLLLLILEQVEPTPAEEIPEKVAEALGPAASERLRAFLGKVQRIGIGKDKGATAVPYKARVVYHLPSWSEPKPSAITIFYLTKLGDPQLQFNTRSLERVAGLDMGQLEADLTRAGCQRTTLPGKELSLFLPDHNDRDTLDRLYEILRGLMERHGA